MADSIPIKEEGIPRQLQLDLLKAVFPPARRPAHLQRPDKH